MSAMTIQNIISWYVKAGCIGWVTWFIICVVRYAYVLYKLKCKETALGTVLNNDEIDDVVHESVSCVSRKKEGTSNWLRMLFELVAWPYGMFVNSMLYDKMERGLIEAFEKRLKY